MQNELPLPKKFTRKQIAIILIITSMLGFLTALILTLIPTDLEVKAIQIVENQAMWHEYQLEIEAKELEILELKAIQESLEQSNNELREQIEASFRSSQK